ncbi:MAG: hypothetical protein HKN47_09450 [Pirellulaceae bacterium]|nr:hypothetical protein [Pirellulaceae bacterium]
MPVAIDGADEFRVVATVHAELHCGKRALGFVWFRSIIQLVRQQSWIGDLWN